MPSWFIRMGSSSSTVRCTSASRTTWCYGPSTSCTTTATTCAGSTSRTASADLAIWLARAAIGRLLHSETFEEGDRLLEQCDVRGLEGVVAKHRASIYRSGRSTSWVKVKCPAWREANRNRGELFGESR